MSNLEDGQYTNEGKKCYLPEGFNEGHGLNVTNSAAQLDDADSGRAVTAIDGDMRDALNPVLDGVCDVRHHLHRLPQVVSTPLALDHRLHACKDSAGTITEVCWYHMLMV